MKKQNKHRKYGWVATVALLLVATFWSVFQLSYGGFAISAHIGVLTKNTASISEVCTEVEISKRSYGISKYGKSKSKVYDFHLSNGEIYRICCSNFGDEGITDEQLQSLEGSVITVEHATMRLTHKAYPLLSLKDENGTVISKQVASEFWENSWGRICLALYIGGGISIAIILSNITC